MIRSRPSSFRSSRTALIAIAAVVLGMLGLAGSALATGTAATKTVRYRGLSLRVPADWPVFRLGSDSSVCVRFNRHAVYLGRPGDAQLCPQQAIGRTEAILVSPAGYHGALLPTLSGTQVGAASASMVRVRDRRDHVVITATWGKRPATIRTALGIRSLRALVLATNRGRPQPVRIPFRRGGQRAHQTNPASPATPGETFDGLGFDVCSAPSTASMSAWGQSSPYAAVGIYIGGVNAACLGGNLNASWVSTESTAGWHLLPLYVGLQAPGGCCKAMSSTETNGQFITAASQGTAAAQDAVVQAQALGIGTSNPIYYDMENYTRSATNSGAVLAFLQAWTVQLHTSGYLSGVYSSGSSGITDLAANYGTSYIEPDALWTAAWDSAAPATPPTTPANSYVPAADWACNDQLLQYYSDPTKSPETYGGVTIGTDRDFVDAPTAAYGSGTLVAQGSGPLPTLTIKPFPDGSVELTPAAGCETGVASYTILAGASPLALTTIDTASPTTAFPLKLKAVYAYYEVQTVNSLGQVIGTSAPVQTPASLAIFGNSAYVGTKGPVGVPVACLNLSPCQLEAQIFDGTRRIAHSTMVGIGAQGGQLLVPLSGKIHRLIAAAHHLPVTVDLLSAGGATAMRALNLITYAISGRAPTRRIWPSSVLQLLGSTSYVSNGWTGGVLASCRAAVPCVSTVHVTLGGVSLATTQTTTLGPGEVGYLTYTLSSRGHRLLRAQRGNQLGARLTISTTAPPVSEAAAPAAVNTAMALISLVAFR